MDNELIESNKVNNFTSNRTSLDKGSDNTKLKKQNDIINFNSENKEYFESILKSNRDNQPNNREFNFYNVTEKIKNHAKNKNIKLEELKSNENFI